MKNIESRKRLPYNHCMGSKSFKAAMRALAEPETREEPHIFEFYRDSHYNKKKDKWIDPKCQEIHEKLVAEREKCTQEGAIQLTQEQTSINVLGGRSGYLRGFGNGPKPMSTTRSTRTDSEDGECGALRATVERLQNENAARSQEMEQMKNNQVAMQRQMEEMMLLVARVTGSDMMTQGGVLT
eukprot:TRINITY_DN4112_c0_g1_i5.p2 TRINITY_DN4112_c0_g1~~TRINITY_DN4112_c0_g1_i5.p2  ORF type:complete len:183 (+),score=39.09 TRINITY_DN4112_c0_g1_i5:948-1496(+)